MELVEIRQPFSCENPYAPSLMASVSSALFGNRQISLLDKGDRLVELADQIANWGKKVLFSNYEKQVDFVGHTALALDWSVYGTILGVEAATFANNVFHLKLENHPYLACIPSLIRFLATPTAIFFLAMGTIEGLVELVNLRRVANLLISMQNHRLKPLQALEIIKDNYFSLSKKEAGKIHQYIQQRMPHLSRQEKEAHYNHIALKALKVKYDSLKRRITPGLAREVKGQLSIIMNDLQSWNPSKVNAATKRAELLIQSVSAQAKNKILIHILGLSAIALTLASIIVGMVGVSSLPVIASLGGAIIGLVILKFILANGPLANELDKLTTRLNAVRLQEVS